MALEKLSLSQFLAHHSMTVRRLLFLRQAPQLTCNVRVTDCFILQLSDILIPFLHKIERHNYTLWNIDAIGLPRVFL